MQKKSLLVALFCGALCLTGCLKNEESASVEQVRLAKAEELKASAALKNAQAQAEVIYANAEATMKQAEAALLNAKAETEKVRAELLKVQVKLAEVKVEEEKVELQKRQAELEVILAQAEAGKQAWINVLNNLLAQAQIDALQNELDALDAIAAFENSTAEGAAEYAQKYYGALAEVQRLQLQEIQAKAMKILVETGAKAASKVIDYQIDQIDDQIAENEEIIKALKARQTMTPEEAKAALIEARVALGDAYAAYKDALKVSEGVQKDRDDVWNMTAEFQDDWYKFENGIYDNFYVDGEEFKPAEWEEAGINAYMWHYGVYDDEGEFVPLWNYEEAAWKWERYPGGEVYSNWDPMFEYRVIAPATIEYDNIATVLQDQVEEYALNQDKAVATYAKILANNVKWRKASIANMEKSLAIHKTYVDGRKDAVAKAEEKFLAELDGQAAAEDAAALAWADFRDYWLGKYDASRQLIIDRSEAEKAYKEKEKVSKAKKEALEKKAANIPGLKSDYEAKAKAEAEAEGVYNVALAEQEDATTAIATRDTKKADYETKKAATPGKKTAMETAKATLDKKDEALVRNPKGSAGYEKAKAEQKTAKDAYDAAVEAYNDAVEAEAKAKTAYEKAQAAVDEIEGPAKEAKKAWDEAVKAKEAAAKAVAEAETDVKAGGKTYDAWKTADDATKAAKAELEAKETALKDAIGAKNDATAQEKYEAYKAAQKKAEEAGTAWAALWKLYTGFSVDDAQFGTEEWYNDLYAAEYSWINSNFELDYRATMLDMYGEEVLIGEFLGWSEETVEIPTFTTNWNGNRFSVDVSWDATDETVYGPYNSDSYWVEYYGQYVDAAEDLLDQAVAIAEDNVQKKQDAADEIIAAANAFKAKEESYKAWVAEREEADKAVMQAEIDVFLAHSDYIETKAGYEALEAIADGKFYFYVGEGVTGADEEGFVELSINEAIEELEGNVGMLYNAVAQLVGVINGDFDVEDLQEYDTDNKSIFELTLVKKLLVKAKEYGKVTVEIVLEMLDDQINYIDEQIDIWTVIADKYKVAMFAYLGIDEGESKDDEDEE